MKTVLSYIAVLMIGIIIGNHLNNDIWKNITQNERFEADILRGLAGDPRKGLPPPHRFTILKVVDRDSFVAMGGGGIGDSWMKFYELPSHGFVDGADYKPVFTQRMGYHFEKVN